MWTVERGTRADAQYFVTCAPGVDLSLMAAMCICFDEAKNENNNS